MLLKTCCTILELRLKKTHISPDGLFYFEIKIAREMNLALLETQFVLVDASTVTVPVIQPQQNLISFWGSHDEVLAFNAKYPWRAAESIMPLQIFNRECIFPRKTDHSSFAIWGVRNNYAGLPRN